MSGLAYFFRDFLPPTVKRHGYKTSLLLTARPAATEDDDNNTPEERIDFREWKRRRKAWIQTFISQRLLSSSSDTPGSNPQEDKSVEEGEEDAWETQQQSTVQASPPRQREVPHVSEAKYSVDHLFSINLYSEKVDLNLCRVTKMWGFRETRRPKHSKLAFDVMQDGKSPFAHFEDDGPLSTVYQHVLNVEVIQLEPEASSRSAAPYIPQCRPKRRLRVYFYNRYAQYMEKSLQDYQSSTVYLSFSNVPARCIFPVLRKQCLDPQQELLDYCICIGDASVIRMQDENVVFDEPQLQVHVGVQQSNSYLETTLTPYTHELLQPKQDGALYQRICAWQQSLQKGKRKRNGDHPKRTRRSLEASFAAVHTRNDISAPTRENTAAPTEENPAQAQGDAAQTEETPAAGDDVNETNTGGQVSDEEFSIEIDGSGHSITRLTDDNDFHYLKLGELRAAFEEQVQQGIAGSKKGLVNVYGAVMEFSSPSRTKRGDWMVTVSLIDDSLPLPTADGAPRPMTSSTSMDTSVHAITLVIFAKDRNSLPQLRAAGEVLRLHRVCVEEWKGDIQLGGRRTSSYVVFRPSHSPATDNNKAWTVVPSSKGTFHLTMDDEKRFISLWKWACRRLLSHATLKVLPRFALANMHPHEETDGSIGDSRTDDLDLVVMVSAVIPYPEDLQKRMLPSPRGFLRVWDGSGPPVCDPLPGATPPKDEPPVEALVGIASIIRMLNEKSSDEEPPLEPPKSLCGRVTNVAIWEHVHWELVLACLNVGGFVRLRNIQERTFSGLRCLMVHSKSWVTPLPANVFEIRKLLSEHNQRVLRKDSFNPRSGILPLNHGQTTHGRTSDSPDASETIQEESVQKSSTLEDFVVNPSSQVFSGSLRIVSAIPRELLTGSSVEPLFAARNHGTSENPIYQFAVCLADQSRDVDAIVGDAAGRKIVGMQPRDALLDPEKALGNLRNVFNEGRPWNATVRSVTFNQARYFLLESLS